MCELRTDTSEKFFPLDFRNITVVDAPLLKEYYWDWFNFTELKNCLLATESELCNVKVKVPPMPINSIPIKIITFIFNEWETPVTWKFKRVQLCDCKIKSISVGINTFKKSFDCPHRTLLTISPNQGVVEGRTMFSTTMFISFRHIGQTFLAYDLIANDQFKIQMLFEFNIHEFDPLSCIITTELFPVYIRKVPHIVQPIWIFNHYNNDMTFRFETKERGLKIITEELTVRRYSMAPLLVNYKPTGIGTSLLKFTMNFEGVINEFTVRGLGQLVSLQKPFYNCPIEDIATPEAPFTISKNYLSVRLKRTESSFTMVAVHNFSPKCIQARWHQYAINGYFSIDIMPATFVCKPNQTVLCAVNIKAENNPCIFFNIPLGCEIYKISDNLIPDDYAQADSVDSSTSLDVEEFVLLTRLWLNVNFRIEGIPNIQVPLGNLLDSQKCIEKAMPSNFNRISLEKIFWRYVTRPKFLDTALSRRLDEITYDDLLHETVTSEFYISRKLTIGTMRALISEAVEEISKLWRFIPVEVAYDKLNNII